MGNARGRAAGGSQDFLRFVEWRAGAQHAMRNRTGDACPDNGRPGHLEVTDNVVARLLQTEPVLAARRSGFEAWDPECSTEVRQPSPSEHEAASREYS